MANNDDAAKENFLMPKSSYWGEVNLPNLTFNSNLQEFAQRVSLICNLETGGKIPPGEAYSQIKLLWKQLKKSKKNLIDNPPTPELPPEEFE
ncbi:MAG: hypothetical protein O2890_02240 [Cyanobacteria bacterium]|nr:hypothetical protein [Cyanobacteriota bacterium]MDA0865236.1 hypothetical protein [Cyanobacteriota bacterium]